MRSRPLIIFLMLASAWLLSGCTTRPSWTLEADGRHRAEINAWTLRVDPAKGRLTELLPPGSAANALTRDAHVVWLGPQFEWPSPWPPPRDWRAAPAASVELLRGGRVLRVVHPHTDPAYPRLVREYTLHADSVDLTVRWTPGEHPHQAIQILQLQPATVAVGHSTPSPSLPHGIAHLPYGPDQAAEWDRAPDPAYATRENPGSPVWLFRRGPGDAKYGLRPNPLHARLPDGAKLSLLPGPSTGRPSPAPDGDLLTQVYLGRPSLPMVEIEQLSPLLRPDRPGRPVSHTARLHLPRAAP